LPCKLPELSLLTQGQFQSENDAAWLSLAAKEEAFGPVPPAALIRESEETFKSSKLHIFTWDNPEQGSHSFKLYISVLEAVHSGRQDFKA